MTQRLFAIGIAVWGLLAIVALSVPARAQEQHPTIVCAPCAGKDFGVPGDQGMVLLAPDGNLWFYPLNRTTPSRIGLLGAVGTPIRWVTAP